MNALTSHPLDAEQLAFVAASADAAAIALVGPPGSGKTHALLSRVITLTTKLTLPCQVRLLTTANPTPLADALGSSVAKTCVISTVAEFAQEVFLDAAETGAFDGEVQLLEDRDAFEHFLGLAEPLLNLEWPEFARNEIDPEVSGLRMPTRFLATTYRLFERLRAANIDPARLEEVALRGTAMFYSAPPNFADAELIRATKDTYRDSLRVNTRALDHQRRRESDLARIVGRLALTQTNVTVDTGTYSPQQALQAVTKALLEEPDFAATVRDRYPQVCIDEAQDLTQAERSFFSALYGKALSGVALAGDIDAAPRAAGAAALTFGMTEATVALQHRYRGNASIWTTHEASMAPISGPRPPHAPVEPTPSVYLLRAADIEAEARTIAREFAKRIADGTAPERCALVLRSLTCAWNYAEALLDEGIPIDFAGPVDPLEDRRAADTHALIWALLDRDATAAYLRIVGSPLLALNDRSIALLCAKPGEPTLFALEPGVPRERSSKAPDRLATNLLDGLNDTAFEAPIRERLEAFRARWNTWLDAVAAEPTIATMSRIIRESGLLIGSDVRTRLSRTMTARFLEALERQHEKLGEGTTLIAALRRYDSLRQLDIEPASSAPIDRTAMVISSAEAIRGFAFDAVAIVGARAGAFPRYYVPEAFLFSPSRGFIPRENVGSTGAGRTAKFTWYLHAVKAREGYNREERRLFASAISRAHGEVFISAAGPATRGVTAPELLEELRRARLKGVLDITPSKPS
jgi:superfamily I DNA/RNA helicase